VPPETGTELLDAGTPGDMVFVDNAPIRVKLGRRAPADPWLLLAVAIGRTDVDVDDEDFRLRLVALGDLRVTVGDSVGIEGSIHAERGSVDVFGRRYRLEQARIALDENPDPYIEAKIVHDFKNLTLTVDVDGRTANPNMNLSGDRGAYTEGQLMSFLLGAEPGDDDSSSQTNQAAVSGGLAILSSRLGRKIREKLPVKLDNLNYEAATASSSRAVRAGIQLSENSFLQWRQRFEARADENPGEAVFEHQFQPWLIFEATAGSRAQGGDFLLRTRW
jgi:hypothetical protein